jgi:mitochondrial fission protein ELM1
MTLTALPQAPVWVLDDRQGPDGGQALALAGRIGLPFLRVPPNAAWRSAAHRQASRLSAPDTAWALGDRQVGPDLVLSAGLRGAARALALRARFGAPVVHCTRHAVPLMPFDLMVRPSMQQAASAPRILSALGPLHVISPDLLGEARRLWRERLSHLPRPRIALVVRTASPHGLSPESCAWLGARLASLCTAHRGSIMASISPAIGAGALTALSEALSSSLHLLYRTDEPGDDPTLGFLGTADAVVVGGASPQNLSEAAAADTPVYADRLGDRGRRGTLLLDTLVGGDLVRPLGDNLSPWPRRPLDEAGRIAREVRRLLDL